jgi:hypothetical protein
MWKQAQQEVRQHWFIDRCIAAFIQVQYRVTGVHLTGLTVARGVGRCPQRSTKTGLLLPPTFSKLRPQSYDKDTQPLFLKYRDSCGIGQHKIILLLSAARCRHRILGCLLSTYLEL